MSKSSGDGAKASRRKTRGSAGEMQTLNEMTSTTKTGTALAGEAERLRAELAAEQQRVQELEEASGRAAARLDAAIETVKAILKRED